MKKLLLILIVVFSSCEKEDYSIKIYDKYIIKTDSFEYKKGYDLAVLENKPPYICNHSK